ncbi:Uu.00g045330.m01.CDS01 [Anthostomella pinea]|uniref:Uu.00g045330.m01.CDS01 n=1 Tax=Anthostomella pinea TaxID=933095 RepID=A0AAI8VB57_9PEZI|nr:Uu.00g045330.m01.CDS01 [Anthostomella pinea]
MATARLPTLRNVLGLGRSSSTLSTLNLHNAQLPRAVLPYTSRLQRRWAQVHDVRFLATTQAAQRSVTEKYREKLDRKAREQGLGGDIDRLKEAYADRIQDLKKRDSVSVPGLDALLADAEPSPLPHTAAPSADGLSQRPPPVPSTPGLGSQTQTPTQAAAGAVRDSTTATKPPIKPLSAILDLPKARALPLPELSAVWRLRHAASANSLCAVVPAATHEALEDTARRHPAFVLPVPRDGQGAEIHFLQWVFDKASRTSTVLFTQLAEYKARGEWAQPHTSITHYWDHGTEVEGVGLSDERGVQGGVVLMAGSVVDGRGASVQDAQWLVMLMQRFYGEEGKGGEGYGAKRRLLEEFGRGDGKFSVERLLEESERLA